MKVYLPSNGIMGIKSVELQEPTISILRNSRNYSQYSIVRKYQFVRDLCGDVAGDMTIFDLNYLFLIGVASLTMNTLTYTVRCDCGKILKGNIKISEKEPIRLKHGLERDVKKSVSGREFVFHLLSVSEWIEIEEYALDLPDEVYQTAREDATVAYTLFGNILPETLEQVKMLTLAQYYQALAYQVFYIHGIDLTETQTCTCGKETLVNYPIEGDLLNFDVSGMLANHVRMANYVSYSDFLDFTLPEYNQYVKSLNAHFNDK